MLMILNTIISDGKIILNTIQNREIEFEMVMMLNEIADMIETMG